MVLCHLTGDPEELRELFDRNFSQRWKHPRFKSRPLAESIARGNPTFQSVCELARRTGDPESTGQLADALQLLRQKDTPVRDLSSQLSIDQRSSVSGSMHIDDGDDSEDVVLPPTGFPVRGVGRNSSTKAAYQRVQDGVGQVLT